MRYSLIVGVKYLSVESIDRHQQTNWKGEPMTTYPASGISSSLSDTLTILTCVRCSPCVEGQRNTHSGELQTLETAHQSL